MSGTRCPAAIAFALTVLLSGCATRPPAPDVAAEAARVDSVIRASIEWAVQKDTAAMFRLFAQDSALFWFSPDSAGTTRGFAAQKRVVEEVFMNPAFVAIGTDIRDMQIHLSRGGDVAWWSCILDDRNTWQGRPANWENVRWTGVVEKREGRWVIVQQHFSKSEEAMTRELRPQEPARRTR
jgi:ketosteroid isomerase-like protein